MPPLRLKRKSGRVTLVPESNSSRDLHQASIENNNRCWYKQFMLDFWEGLLAALDRITMLPSLLHSVLPSSTSRRRVRDGLRTYDRTMDDLLREIQRLLEAPLPTAKMLDMSTRLQAQFAPRLQSSDICMLPSYNHKLPSGYEKGTYLALDVGGSTFRIALVELNGRQPDAKNMRIVVMESYKITRRSGKEEATISLSGWPRRFRMRLQILFCKIPPTRRAFLWVWHGHFLLSKHLVEAQIS